MPGISNTDSPIEAKVLGIREYPEATEAIPNVPFSENYLTTGTYLVPGKQQSLALKGAVLYAKLNDAGMAEFLSASNPEVRANPRRFPTVGGAYARGQVLENTGLALVKKFSLSTLGMATGAAPGTFLVYTHVFWGENDKLFLLAPTYKVSRIRRNGQPDSFTRAYTQKTSLFEVTQPDDGGVAKLKKIGEDTVPEIKSIRFANGFLYTASLQQGALSLNKYSLPGFRRLASQIYHLHQGDRDSFVDVLDGENGNLFLLASWQDPSTALKKMEVIKVDSDLRADPTFASDRTAAGQDGVVDVVSTGSSVLGVFEDIALPEDIVVAVNLDDSGLRHPGLMMVERKTGLLDREFHKNGMVNLPSTTGLRLHNFGRYILTVSMGTDALMLRAFNLKGELVKINEGLALRVPHPATSTGVFYPVKVVSSGNQVHIFGHRTGTSTGGSPKAAVYTLELKVN